MKTQIKDFLENREAVEWKGTTERLNVFSSEYAQIGNYQLAVFVFGEDMNFAFAVEHVVDGLPLTIANSLPQTWPKYTAKGKAKMALKCYLTGDTIMYSPEFLTP